jgi:hypothetical protein
MDITPEAARTAALRFGEADADPKPLQAGLRDSCLAATGCDRWCKNLAARGLRAAVWWLPPSAGVWECFPRMWRKIAQISVVLAIAVVPATATAAQLRFGIDP